MTVFATTGSTTSTWVRRGAVTLALATAAVGLSAASASAAPDDTTDAHVAVVAGITMTGLTEDFTMTGAPGDTIDNGSSPVGYNVQTNNNAGYTVNVTAAAPTLVGTGVDVGGTPNTDTIAISRLQVRNSLGVFASLSNTGSVLVHTQPGRSAIDGDALDSDFQLVVPTVNVDTYSVTLNYVAATL